jgi:N-methylhydantoinase A
LLRPGNAVIGPAVVELTTTTIVVRPGQILRIDPYRNFIVEKSGGRP